MRQLQSAPHVLMLGNLCCDHDSGFIYLPQPSCPGKLLLSLIHSVSTGFFQTLIIFPVKGFTVFACRSFAGLAPFCLALRIWNQLLPWGAFQGTVFILSFFCSARSSP